MTIRFLTRLGHDHQRIERVLTLIESELAKYEDDTQDEDLMAISDALAYLEVYPDRVHHPVEEKLFELLESRVAPVERDAIYALREQHTELASYTQALKKDIDNILNDIVVPMETVSQHLKNYVQIQRQHMVLENNIIFPAAARVMTDADWADFHERLEKDLDPLFEGTASRFNRLFAQIEEEFEGDPVAVT